jgi:hypothetical protein
VSFAYTHDLRGTKYWAAYGPPFCFLRANGCAAAAVIGPALFLLGAAAGHIYNMITAGNFAPGNAGVIFNTDIVIPIIELWHQRSVHSRGERLSCGRARYCDHRFLNLAFQPSVNERYRRVHLSGNGT